MSVVVLICNFSTVSSNSALRSLRAITSLSSDLSFCFNEFIYYSLHSIKLEDWCNAGLVPVINSKTVYTHVIYLPSIQEQEKIAKILTTQDKVIELKEKLLIEKQRQKKYLMQQLLTGKKRLLGQEYIRLSLVCSDFPPSL